jgi:protein-S-isoprenylcysteine O-methyltransferase Ste14
MKRLIIRFLLKFTGKSHSKGYKIVSLTLGAIFFLVILPGIFIMVGSLLKNYISINLNRIVEMIIAFTGIVIGLWFLTWSTITQWNAGKGTPAPNAPTQYLIVSGPYKYCRNPIEFGAIIYYLGIGTFIAGIIVGITSCILGFVIGSSYHKFIEEKELEARFGEAYIKYKKNTPFVFPRIKFVKKRIKL